MTPSPPRSLRYAIHAADARALVALWCELMPRVWAEYPNVDGPNKDPTRHYAEMQARARARRGGRRG